MVVALLLLQARLQHPEQRVLGPLPGRKEAGAAGEKTNLTYTLISILAFSLFSTSDK